jgi:succinate dehydrogenase / fumarate reductase, cytochrome b subunit
MSSFLSASIGKKFIMSVSGLFLILFLAVHLIVNLLLIFDDSGELYNVAANFMSTNPLIRTIEPVLGLGFLVHILWSFVLEYNNWKARPLNTIRKTRVQPVPGHRAICWYWEELFLCSL